MVPDVAILDEKAAVLRWRRGHQAAERRQRELRAAAGPDQAQAIGELRSALNLLESMGQWPAPRDPASERAVEQVRSRWARVQQRARRSQER